MNYNYFDPDGRQISQLEWIDFYQPYYYLGGPTLGRSINQRNQSCELVERKIEDILRTGVQCHTVTVDIPSIIAWKIGEIDQMKSCEEGTVKYNEGFETDPTDRYGRSLKALIKFCEDNCTELNNLSQRQQYQSILDWLLTADKINWLVYCITLLYFYSKGKCPIYDRFADKALDAILSDKRPGEAVPYKGVTPSGYFDKFVPKLTAVFNRQDIPREIDRALWAYGHFFNNPEDGEQGVNGLGGRTPPKRPSTKVRSNGGPRNMYERFLEVFQNKVGKFFVLQQIRKLVTNKFPDIKERGIIPTDYCYNSINKGARDWRPLFRQIDRGEFKYLGPDSDYSGGIWWNEKDKQNDKQQVGRWIDGRCELWDDPRE